MRVKVNLVTGYRKPEVTSHLDLCDLNVVPLFFFFFKPLFPLTSAQWFSLLSASGLGLGGTLHLMKLDENLDLSRPSLWPDVVFSNWGPGVVGNTEQKFRKTDFWSWSLFVLSFLSLVFWLLEELILPAMICFHLGSLSFQPVSQSHI